MRAVKAKLRAVKVKLRAVEVRLSEVETKLREFKFRLGADEVKMCAAEVQCQKPAPYLLAASPERAEYNSQGQARSASPLDQITEPLRALKGRNNSGLIFSSDLKCRVGW